VFPVGFQIHKREGKKEQEEEEQGRQERPVHHLAALFLEGLKFLVDALVHFVSSFQQELSLAHEDHELFHAVGRLVAARVRLLAVVGQVGLDEAPDVLLNGPRASFTTLFTPTDRISLAEFPTKTKNYLIQEPSIVKNAWGPMPPGVTSLLYWDVDVATGEVTRGFTTSTFSYSYGYAPPNPTLDQHWFDTQAWTMNVWNGTSWVIKIRVFAGTYNSSNTVTAATFKSQVSNHTQSNAGYILYDLNQRAIIDPTDETFVTTGDGLVVQMDSFSLPVSMDASVAYVTAAESIPAKSLVSVIGNNQVRLADAGTNRYAVAMVEDDAAAGSTVRLLFSGVVYNDQWNFAPSLLGKPIFLGSHGEFTFVSSNFGMLQVVGVVLFPNAIVFMPGFQTSAVTVKGGVTINNVSAGSTVPYIINNGDTFDVPTDAQVDATMNIVNDGFIMLDGFLTFVDTAIEVTEQVQLPVINTSNFTVPENSQAGIFMNVKNDGLITLNGYLIEVI